MRRKKDGKSFDDRRNAKQSAWNEKKKKNEIKSNMFYWQTNVCLCVFPIVISYQNNAVQKCYY